MKDEVNKELAFDVWVSSEKTRTSRHFVIYAESIVSALEKIKQDYPVGNGDYYCHISQK